MILFLLKVASIMLMLMMLLLARIGSMEIDKGVGRGALLLSLGLGGSQLVLLLLRCGQKRGGSCRATDNLTLQLIIAFHIQCRRCCWMMMHKVIGSCRHHKICCCKVIWVSACNTLHQICGRWGHYTTSYHWLSGDDDWDQSCRISELCRGIMLIHMLSGNRQIVCLMRKSR